MNHSQIFQRRYSGYKRTTDKQYSLLTHEMARFRVKNLSIKSADGITHWNTLAEKLNDLGPPYRTVQQWKKVWSDFKRFHSKRNFKSTPKFTKTIKPDSNTSCDLFGVEEQEEEDDDEIFRFDNIPATSSKVAKFLRSEWEEYDQNSQSIHSTHSIDYVDEYAYPDGQSLKQETLTPDENHYDSYTYDPPYIEERTTHKSVTQPSSSNYKSLSMLESSTNQTVYALPNQMENHTQLLEHLSNISSTIACLMERQVNAIEKQTEAIQRQSSALEHHTSVMNSFVDMIREKKAKTNSKISTGLSNGTP